MRPAGQSLPEVVVAMAVATLFLLLTASLATTSLRAATFLRQKELARTLADDLLDRTRGGWMRDTTTPADGQVTLEGTTFAYTVRVSPVALGGGVVTATPAAAVEGQDWTGMQQVTVTVTWVQEAGLPRGQVVRSSLVCQTVASPSPSPAGGPRR